MTINKTLTDKLSRFDKCHVIKRPGYPTGGDQPCQQVQLQHGADGADPAG